ncbi:MAG: hypothetical protein D6690_09065 [Nitrospirae bacterium]|nr:MAG: hypothetical protein D6690_09065 [Nitrospirota bacterium]
MSERSAHHSETSFTSHSVTPERILQIASGFMAAKHLFAANEIGLFDALAQGPATLAELGSRLRLPLKTLRIIADALVSLGLITKTDTIYRHSAVSEAFLSGHGSQDLRPFLTFWNRLSYPNWLRFEEAVRGRSSPQAQTTWTPQEMELFSKGVEAVTAGTAEALARTFDFSSFTRLLDIGGGTGSFLIPILGHYPHLRATLFELPTVISIAEARLHPLPVSEHITCIAGDFLVDSLPEGHDIVLIANVLHLLSPEHCLRLLEQTRHSVAVGAHVLLVDFWTDSTHTQPTFAALMAGEFFLVTGEGDVYSVAEATDWLIRTGWDLVGHQALTGPASLIVAKAR